MVSREGDTYLGYPAIAGRPRPTERAREEEAMLLGLFTKARSRWLCLRERWNAEGGAVATEYALLLILVALAIIAAATAFGLALSGKFSETCNSLSGVNC